MLGNTPGAFQNTFDLLKVDGIEGFLKDQNNASTRATFHATISLTEWPVEWPVELFICLTLPNQKRPGHGTSRLSRPEEKEKELLQSLEAARCGAHG